MPVETQASSALEGNAANPGPIARVPGGAIAGVVRDRTTRAPVGGALVLLDGDHVATTDDSGRFHLKSVTTGSHLLSVAGPRGEEAHRDLVVRSAESAQLALELGLREVESFNFVQKVVRPKKSPGEVTLSKAEVSAVPGTMGDPVRVIENLPGASRAPGGFGGALIIRGANPADSAVLMDGVQIPILYHFMGLTSVVNPEFLSAVSFMPGGFGAEYGRATAGVAEVESTALSCGGFRGSAAVDVLDAELFSCVKLGQWRLAAAGRRSYIDAFLPSIMKAAADDGESVMVLAPSFFDYQLKAETVRGGNRFEIFAFGSHDSLELTQSGSAEDLDFQFGGTLAFHRLQLRHVYVGERLTLTSAVTPGFLRQLMTGASKELGTEERQGVDISTVQWRETATYRAADWLTLRGGLDHVLSHWRADFVTPLPTLVRRYPSPLEVDVRDRNVWKRRGTDLDQGYWAEATAEVAGLAVTPGLRLDHLVFDETKRLHLQPRLRARWQVAEGAAVTGAAGVYRKLPDTFSGVIVDGFGQPDLAAERAMHFVTGIEQRLGPLETKLEAFYVKRDRLPSPTDEVQVRDGKAEPVLFASDGTGRSYGLELLVRLPAEQRRFSGWVAYTLSRSYRKDRSPDATGFDTYETQDAGTPRLSSLPPEAREYLSPFDQTHILTVVGKTELPWGLSLGMRFQLVSGNPMTPLEKGQSYYDADADQYKVRPGSVARGSGRLPAFHRIDLRLDKRWQFEAWSLTAYLEVMNAYNAKSIEAFDYDYRFRSRLEVGGLPILPLLGVKGEI